MKTIGEIKILDSLRGAAALSVCLYHFVCTTTGYVTNEYVLSFFGFGKHGVQMFFVISGFIIPWSMAQAGYQLKNLPKFLGKRLIRLEPPYMVALFLAIIILAVRARILGPDSNLQGLSFPRIALHFGYLIPFFQEYKWVNQVFWTLAVEFQYYFVIALIFPVFNLKGIGFRLTLYFVALAAMFFSSSAFLPYWAPLFLLGIVLFYYKSEKIKAAEYWLVTSLVLCFGLFRYEFGDVLFSGIAVFVIAFYANVNLKFGDFFGKISYSLYLIHPIVGATAINLLSHRFTEPYQKVLVIILGLLISIAGAFVMYYFIERPSKNFSRKISYTK